MLPNQNDGSLAIFSVHAISVFPENYFDEEEDENLLPSKTLCQGLTWISVVFPVCRVMPIILSDTCQWTQKAFPVVGF